MDTAREGSMTMKKIKKSKNNKWKEWADFLSIEEMFDYCIKLKFTDPQVAAAITRLLELYRHELDLCDRPW